MYSGLVEHTKTIGDELETPGDITEHQALLKRLDHLDDMAHATLAKVAAIQEVIEEHRPLLARGAALMNPGAGVLAYLKGGKRAVREDGPQPVPEP